MSDIDNIDARGHFLTRDRLLVVVARKESGTARRINERRRTTVMGGIEGRLFPRGAIIPKVQAEPNVVAVVRAARVAVLNRDVPNELGGVKIWVRLTVHVILEFLHLIGGFHDDGLAFGHVNEVVPEFLGEEQMGPAFARLAGGIVFNLGIAFQVNGSEFRVDGEHFRGNEFLADGFPFRHDPVPKTIVINLVGEAFHEDVVMAPPLGDLPGRGRQRGIETEGIRIEGAAFFVRGRPAHGKTVLEVGILEQRVITIREKPIPLGGGIAVIDAFARGGRRGFRIAAFFFA